MYYIKYIYAESGLVKLAKGPFNYYISALGGGRGSAEKLTFAYQNGGTGRSKGKMLTCLSKIIEQQYQTRKPSF